MINGQKIWTSLAQFSKWMILLCRHDRGEKYTGLTYFMALVLPEVGKSVEIRPLVKMTGESGFNEVFLNNLEIPDPYRLDAVGRGWQVAMTTLLHERGASPLVTPRSAGTPDTESSVNEKSPQGLIKLAEECTLNGQKASDNPAIRDRIMQLIIREKAFVQSDRRARVKGLIDNDMRIPIQAKLVSFEIQRNILGERILGLPKTK